MHRIRVGIIGVIDDGDAIAAGAHIHTVRRTRLVSAERTRDNCGFHARFDGRCGRGQGVGDLVLAKDLQLNLHRRDAGGVEGKGRAGDIVKLNVCGIVLRIRGLRSIGGIKYHLGLRARCHRSHEGIVRIQHRYPAVCRGGQGLNELALGLGDIFTRTKLTQVGGAHVEHHAHRRGRDLGQVANMADAARGHLRHEETRMLIAAQGGIGKAHLVIEGARRGDGFALGAEDGSQQILSRGLARGAGNADDIQALFRGETGSHLAREIG